MMEIIDLLILETWQMHIFKHLRLHLLVADIVQLEELHPILRLSRYCVNLSLLFSQPKSESCYLHGMECSSLVPQTEVTRFSLHVLLFPARLCCLFLIYWFSLYLTSCSHQATDQKEAMPNHFSRSFSISLQHSLAVKYPGNIEVFFSLYDNNSDSLQEKVAWVL